MDHIVGNRTVTGEKSHNSEERPDTRGKAVQFNFTERFHLDEFLNILKLNLSTLFYTLRRGFHLTLYSGTRFFHLLMDSEFRIHIFLSVADNLN